LASIAPSRLPALHAGAPLLVLGRYAGPASGAVSVTAQDADGNPWSAEVTVVEGGSDALTPAWARARIRDLEDQYVVSPNDATEHEIVATSLDGHVLSRFTAFVAVDVTVVNEGGRVRRVTQPVDAPHGWDMFGAAPDYAPMSVAGFAPAAAPMIQAAGAAMTAAPSPSAPMPSAFPAPVAGDDRARAITGIRRPAAKPVPFAKMRKQRPD